MQTCSCFSVGVSVARNRSVTLVLSRWADTISRKRRQERGAGKNHEPLKETAVWKVKKYILFGKKGFVYCIFIACLATVANIVLTLSHWLPTQTEESKIRMTDQPATGPEVAAFFLPDTVQTYNFSGTRIHAVISLLQHWLKIGKVNVVSNFSWSKSIIMLPVRTNGEQTRPKNSSCYSSYKFTYIWWTQQWSMKNVMCFTM